MKTPIKVTSVRANTRGIPEGPVQFLDWEALEMPDGEIVSLFQINRHALLFSDGSVIFMSEHSQFPTLESAKSSEVWWARDFKLAHRPVEGMSRKDWKQHVKDHPIPMSPYFTY